MKIRKKILLFVLCISIFAIVTLGIFDFSDLNNLKNSLSTEHENYGNSMYSQNIDDVSQISLGYAQVIATSQGRAVNSKFTDISDEIKFTSDYLSDLYSHKSHANSLYGEIYFSLLPGVSKSDVLIEYSNIKSLQDVIYNITKNTDKTIYYVSESGIIISNNSDVGNEPFVNIDKRERPWYTGAVNSKSLVWSDPYTDVITNKSVITCSIPIYDENDNLKGVLAEDFILSNFSPEIIKSNTDIITYSFVIDKGGNFVFGSEEGKTPSDYLNDEFYSSLIQNINNNENKNGVYSSSGYLTGYSPIENTQWELILVLNYNEILKPANNIKSIIDSSGVTLLNIVENKMFLTFIWYAVILITTVLVVSFVSKKFTKAITTPIDQIKEGAQQIGDGNLNTNINVNTNDELKELSIEFNEMAVNLKTQMKTLEEVTAQKNKIRTELNIAKKIQNSMLPSVFPPFPDIKEIDLFASAKSAKAVGGDFYDFFIIDNDMLAFVIADVSDKGIPAALFMVTTKTLIKSQAQRGLSPKDILETVNNNLCEDNNANMFVTAIVGILNIKTGEITISNAGHNLPLIYRADKSFDWLNLKSNFVLAGIKNVHYSNETLTLYPGDKIFLYTDGITEALNSKNELFSNQRLIDCLNDGSLDSTSTVYDILEHVQNSVKQFTKNSEQSDDMTMLTIDYHGNIN